ncbi:M1 family aminopeptidase [Nemorincola caseinilytica]|uniref:Aminopeptidase N n=1 Tax=Nemorincola caseinilytica TaxID=2054315 RepID=A0ABP8N992_9BACT
MKRKLTILCTAIMLLLPYLSRTAHAGNPCMDKKKGRGRTAVKTTALGDPAEDNYDIKHLRFELKMTDTSIYVQGNVTTTARVAATTMSEYVFELSNALTIDSAKVDGVTLPVTTTGSIRRITLPVALTAGTMFAARIWYQGTPPAGSGGFFNGITHTVSSGGTHMVYTVSDPWVALNWWPTKQSVLDQADSVDMLITVPENVMDGSTGKLVNVDMTTIPGWWTYHWKTNYPIDYYLISLAIARYSEYKSYAYFTGSSDSVLVQNFFMDTASFNPAHKVKFDSVRYMIDYFSTLWGRYPFWQEKFGMCFTTLTGGMEHQNMVTIGVTDVETIAHELAHQWFGDHVTYRSWKDMWLSEGFATYSEHLYREHFHGAGPAKQRRQQHLSSAVGQACGRTYITDTSTSDSLFTANQYTKASIILHTLRYMAPHDTVFFKTLRTYQSMYSFGNATTEDFKAVAEATYGMDLDTFFNQWIYGRGYPIYRTKWNQVGSTVIVQLMQSQSCPSYTNHFSTPVQIQLRAGTLDTFIKVYNNVDTQTFTFDWAPTVTNVYLNTDVWVVMRNIGITKDPTLTVGMNDIEHGRIRIHPNPTENYWQIDPLPEETDIALMDMTGKVLWEGRTGKGSTTIPGERLPSGTYLLRLSGAVTDNIRLVRW